MVSKIGLKTDLLSPDFRIPSPSSYLGDAFCQYTTPMFGVPIPSNWLIKFISGQGKGVQNESVLIHHPLSDCSPRATHSLTWHTWRTVE